MVDETDEDLAKLTYREDPQGWFTEISLQTVVEVPWERIADVRIETGDARIEIEFDRDAEGVVLELAGGRGDVVIIASEVLWKFVEGVPARHPVAAEGAEAGIEVRVGDGFLGELRTEEGGENMLRQAVGQ